RHFLHHDVGPDSVAAHHRRLVQALDAVGDAPGADAVQRYRLLWLPYHLAEGRERARLEALFLDFAWLQQKLGAIGPAALLADFRLVQDRPAHRRLGDALPLSRPILAGQLVGRLSSDRLGELDPLLRAATASAARPWLHPLIASLAAPGGPLLRTLEGHEVGVTAVVAIPDSPYAVSGSGDGVLIVWDLETGAIVRSMQGRSEGVKALAVMPDACLLSGEGYEDAVVRIWNVETG